MAVEYHDGQARFGARQFQQTGDDLASLANSLNSELSGDSPWSQDKIGSAFAEKFDKDRSTVIDNVKKFAENIQDIAPKLTQISDAIVAQSSTWDQNK